MLHDSEAIRLIEKHAGRHPIATDDGFLFVFRGHAEEVELAVMEDRFPPVGEMRSSQTGDTWFIEVPAPPDAVIEYKFAVTRSGRRRLILDPENTNRSRDPYGSNSVALGPRYETPTWLESGSDESAVIPITVESKVWGRTREHHLYLPGGYEPARNTPLVILHDGRDYVEYAHLRQCLGALSAADKIPKPLVLLHQPAHRHTEYADSPRHVSHVLDEILPLIEPDHNFDRVIAGGASLGGVASVSIAYRRPGAIDGLILQSASLVQQLGGPYHRSRVLAPALRLTRAILDDPSGLPDRVVASCGTFDGLVEDHRKVMPALSELVPALSYQEINAGHHWICWRDRLEPDLIAALAA